MDAADLPFVGEVTSAAGLAVYGNLDGIDPARSYYTLAASYDGGGDLFAFDAEGNLVGTADLGSDILPSGLGAVPASTTLLVSSAWPMFVGSAAGVSRFVRHANGTYTEVASGSVGVSAWGGVVAGVGSNQRYWAFSGTGQSGGKQFIRSWALGDDLSASQTLKLGNGSDLIIETNSGLVSPGFSHALAVQVDASATRVYWVDESRKLYRYADVGGTIAIEMIKAFAPASPELYGAVAASGSKLYVAVDRTVYVVHDPTVASSALQVDPIASYALNAGGSVTYPFGGTQTRPGSVVFGFYGSPGEHGVQRFTVPR